MYIQVLTFVPVKLIVMEGMNVASKKSANKQRYDKE